MRTNKGKLITVFVPGNHGAGGTTLASGIGISLQYFLNKKVLLINKSGSWSYMERFLDNEPGLKFNYTIDDLQAFNSSVNKDYIKTFATKINDDLFIIAGSSYSKDITVRDEAFEERLIEESLAAFDIVIVDVPTGVRHENLKYLDASDLILAVMTPNDIMLEDIYAKPAKEAEKQYLQAPNAVPVFNMMPEGQEYDKEMSRLNKKYKLDRSFGVIFDYSVRNACCTDRRFYTYLRSELDKANYVFPQQMKELCAMICTRLEVDYPSEVPAKTGFFNKLFKQF